MRYKIALEYIEGVVADVGGIYIEYNCHRQKCDHFMSRITTCWNFFTCLNWNCI